VVAIVMSAALLGGCTVRGLQLRTDDRLSFEAPAAGRRASLPLTVRWSMRGFTASGLDGSRDTGRGLFAVFVDRSPMSPGRPVTSLVDDDQSCRRDPRCPDAAYLADAGVFVTADPSITLTRLPKADDGVGDERHSVTVVLLDGTSRRIGESAWYRSFTTKRATR
jgi:hypothetical protein